MTSFWVFYGALLFCCICIYIYFRTLRIFGGETFEFLLEKCYVNIIWTGACKLLPVLCSPRGGRVLWNGTRVSLWACDRISNSLGQRRCKEVCEGSCQVQAPWWGQAVSGCRGSVPVAAVPSTPARERPAALASVCLKCLQNVSLYLLCSSTCLLFVFFSIFGP